MVPKIFSGKRPLAFLSFLLLSFLVSGAIGFIKVESLMSWGYTSDLFTYDTVLKETLLGHIGLEFTFGNTFGDHAYPILFLLLPFKLVLQHRMVRLLVLLAPLACFLSANILFSALRQIKGPRFAFWIAGVFLLGFFYTFRGIYEELYGFHPDTLSGYIAVAFTSFLIWREFRKQAGLPTSIQVIGFWVFFILFISLKEEMAFLGVVFFLAAVILRRDCLNFTALLIAILSGAAEFLFVRYSQTPFNRTNELLLGSFIQAVQRYGISYFLHSSISSPPEVLAFWLALSLSIILFAGAAFLSGKVQRYAACLLVIGVSKLALSLINSDFTLTRWHNFPGLVMLIGAVLWQASLLEDKKTIAGRIFPAAIFVAAAAGFLFNDVPFFFAKHQDSLNRTAEVNLLNRELDDLQPFIAMDRIVAIPHYSAVRWGKYRLAFFPRGVTRSPRGIADYVVYSKNVPAQYTGGAETALPLEELEVYFSVVDETQHFILLKRFSLPEDQRVSREEFQQAFHVPPDFPPP